jgi:hypothetical protein
MPNIDNETRDKTSPVWDMSQERALLEGLVSQRLHFFLIFVSALLATAINAKLQIQLQLLLTSGAAISWWIALAISRVLARLDVTLKILSTDETHPFSQVNRELGKSEVGRGWVVLFLWATCLLISIAAALVWARLITVPSGA